MIDERLLIDPARCPSCGSPLVPGAVACRSCGVPLRGELPRRVWDASVAAHRALALRTELVAQLRRAATPTSARLDATSAPPPSRAHPPAAPSAAYARNPPAYRPNAPTGADEALTAPSARPAPARPLPSFPAPPSGRQPRLPKPADEVSAWRIQNLLLALGALLLAVAAVIFLAVSWGHLGIGGRGLAMAIATSAAAAGAAFSRRRGLTATAEAVGSVAVVLALLDALAVRLVDLGGAGGATGTLFWAGALTLVTMALAVGSVPVPLRSWRWSAAALGQLPLVLVGAELAIRRDSPEPVAVVLAVQAALTLVVALRLRGDRHLGERTILVSGGAAFWLAALLSGTAAAADTGAAAGDRVLGSLALALLAGVAAAAARATEATPSRTLAASAATVAALAAGFSAPTAEVPTEWRAPLIAVAAVLAAAAGRELPKAFRTGVAAVSLGVAALAGAILAAPLALVVVGPFGWLTHAWSSDLSGSTTQLLTPALDTDPMSLFGWGAPLPVTTALVTVAVGVALAACAVRQRVVAAALVTGATVTWTAVLPVTGLSVPTVLVLDTAAGLAALLTGAAIASRRLKDSRYAPAFGLPAALSGAFLLARVAAWSALSESATPFVGAAVLLGVVAAAFVGPRQWRAVATGAAATLMLTEVGVVTAAVEPSPAFVGVAVAAAAALLALGARAVSTEDDVAHLAALAAVGYVVAVVLSGTDAQALAVSLAVGAVATGVLAAWDADRMFAWASGILTVAATWTELRALDVSGIDAYTAPAGIALLGVGAWFRRRIDASGPAATHPVPPSWIAYGPGLVALLAPSTCMVVVGAASDLRALVLGVASLAVLITGSRSRLQAPVVIGGTALAVDAVVQLAPYVGDLYHALPRWVLLALAGGLLLGLGATYERRVRDLQRLTGRLAGLG